MLSKLAGLLLMLFGIYFLGQNIYYTTNPHPYWWRGVKADGSILSLTAGVAMLFLLPREGKILGTIAIILGVILVFLSGNVVLRPTTLWQFFVSISALTMGYKLFSGNRFYF